MQQGVDVYMAGKIIGSLLILLACFCMGYRLSIREKLRLNELIYIKNAITKISSELEFNRMTFLQALSSAVDIEENIIFSSIYNAVKNNNSVKTAWKYAFEENAEDSYMTKEDIERLSAIGEGFNSGDIELQRRYVQGGISYINSQEEIIKPRLEKDTKLYRSVSLTIGLFIVLLLV